MKFIKNGNEYAGIEQAYFAHCGIMAHCEKCGMQGKTAKNSDCRAYACNHPVEAAYLMGFELRESNMKKYAPERLGEYVHTIRVTLMQDDYTGHIAYEVTARAVICSTRTVCWRVIICLRRMTAGFAVLIRKCRISRQCCIMRPEMR